MKRHLKATILGCGSSGGVPRIGNDWGACDPTEPKNRRLRSALLIEAWEGDIEPAAELKTSVLIDTSPDLREQLLRSEVKRLDAVLLTHEHADQTHGIDDLRAIAYRMRARIPVFTDARTADHMMAKFGYCFEMPEGRVHPAILEMQSFVTPDESFTVSGPGGDICFEALSLSHGPTPSLGFLVDECMAYTPDVHDIDTATLERISYAETWIVDALRYADHPTHAHADKTLSWLAHTRISHGVLTNLHIDMDFESLRSELPGRHEPAYDGMVIRKTTP